MDEDVNTQNLPETRVIRVGEEFVIALDAMPTAGYTWQAKFDNEYLRLVDESFQPHDTEIIGSGARQVFSFRAVRAGETTVTLVYKRPWELAVKRQEAFSVEIRE